MTNQGFGKTKNRPPSTPRMQKIGTIGERKEVAVYGIPHGVFNYCISKLRGQGYVLVAKSRDRRDSTAFVGQDLSKVKQAYKDFIAADVVIVERST